MTQLFIEWDINPDIINLGFISLRYYSLLFLTGLVFSGVVVHSIFRKEGISDDLFLSLFYSIFFGILIGARLGHCLFYEPEYFLRHPLEIILPFKIEDGMFMITGYQGLASHGGAIGIVIALGIFCYRHKINMIRLLDYISVGAPLCAAFIRLGNLMNSEIIGKTTDLPWAFRFLMIDNEPRHPAQLYESLVYLIVFGINCYIYRKWGDHLKTGFIFGFTITYIFISRFLIEFIKENQVSFEDNISFNMGQILSIPYILAGIWFMFFYNPKKENSL